MSTQTSSGSKVKKQENIKNHFSKDTVVWSELWTDGLLCAFEFVQGARKSTHCKSCSKIYSAPQKECMVAKKSFPVCGMKDTSKRDMNENSFLDPAFTDELSNASSILGVNEITQFGGHNDNREYCLDTFQATEKIPESHWVPIGWARISELIQTVQVDSGWDSQIMELADGEDGLTVADIAVPYWQNPAGPTWWCHVDPEHQSIDAWLTNAQWLHPAISVALRDESRLISERMKRLFYEVPVRVAGGLLFELLGQSAGDPFSDEDDIPIVLRSWQAQNFLITALHIKGSSSNVDVLGITEVQELLASGGNRAPKSIHEVIAQLACRLSRWDDRLFRKYIFGAADEVELKFVQRRDHISQSNMREHVDLTLLSIILNQEIRRLSVQVIRVKWSLHAREEIVFELLQHLRGNTAKSLMEGIRKSTRDMIEEQEAVRDRLFTIQDVMQNTTRAWLQDRSVLITHNLAVFGGCGLVLSIITGLFGINVDGIPGNQNTPCAFALFTGLLLLLAVALIGFGLLYLGLKQPITDEQVQVRRLELQQMISSFHRDAETHARVIEAVSKHKLPPTAADMLQDVDVDYILLR